MGAIKIPRSKINSEIKRIKSFSNNRANKEAVKVLIEKNRCSIEWAAPEMA
jgi:hypothetical protein